MINLATAKLIGIGVGALAVIALLAMVNGWRVERNHLHDWQTQVLAATRDASGVKKLPAKEVAAQIRAMGQGLADAKDAIAKQNAAVNAMADASAKARHDAEKAVSAAKERAKAAESVSDRLAASANDLARKKAPCEPSKALVGAWQ